MLIVQAEALHFVLVVTDSLAGVEQRTA